MVPMHANAIKLVLLVPPAVCQAHAVQEFLLHHMQPKKPTPVWLKSPQPEVRGEADVVWEIFKNSIMDILCPRSTSFPVKHIPIYCSYSCLILSGHNAMNRLEPKPFWRHLWGEGNVWTQPPLEAHFYLCGASPAWQHSTKWPPSGVGT